jgi:hypothetical protein
MMKMDLPYYPCKTSSAAGPILPYYPYIYSGFPAVLAGYPGGLFVTVWKIGKGDRGAVLSLMSAK